MAVTLGIFNRVKLGLQTPGVSPVFPPLTQSSTLIRAAPLSLCLSRPPELLGNNLWTSQIELWEGHQDKTMVTVCYVYKDTILYHLLKKYPKNTCQCSFKSNMKFKSFSVSLEQYISKKLSVFLNICCV